MDGIFGHVLLTIQQQLTDKFSIILDIFITNIAIGTILSTTDTNDDPCKKWLFVEIFKPAI